MLLLFAWPPNAGDAISHWSSFRTLGGVAVLHVDTSRFLLHVDLLHVDSTPCSALPFEDFVFSACFLQRRACGACRGRSLDVDNSLHTMHMPRAGVPPCGGGAIARLCGPSCKFFQAMRDQAFVQARRGHLEVYSTFLFRQPAFSLATASNSLALRHLLGPHEPRSRFRK